MLDDSFKIRYKTVPMAISFQNDSSEATVAHNHSEFEILLITDGKCSVTVNGRTYTAKSGDMIFINPMEIHSIKPNSAISHKCICFDCSVIMDKNICESLKNESIHIIHHISSKNASIKHLRNIFSNIIESFESDNNYSELEITSYISLMFAHLLKNAFIDKNVKKTKNTVFCSKVLEYISQHYGENITSKEIAEALSYNQSYFCRSFRKNFDKCFSDYLNMYRIATSRKLLEAGRMTITQIATECGFNSAAYFTICFKKHLGVLPSEYKKRVEIK